MKTLARLFILLVPLLAHAQTPSLQANVSGQLNLGLASGAAPSFIRIQLVNCAGTVARASDGTIVNFAPFDVNTTTGAWSTKLYGNDTITCNGITGGSAWRMTPYFNNLAGPAATYIVQSNTNFVIDNAPLCGGVIVSNCSLDSGVSPSTIAITSIAVTNPGVFTNTQMNEYITSMINSCSTTTLQSLQGGMATNAISGCLTIPSTATVISGDAIAGYVQNLKAESATPSTTPVGVLGLCQAAAANADCLGGSFIATDVSSPATGILIGVDSSVIALDAGTRTPALIGVTSVAQFQGTGPYPTSVAYQASTANANQWNTAYQSNNGAATTFASIGTELATGTSDSQPILMNVQTAAGADNYTSFGTFSAAPSGPCGATPHVRIAINASATTSTTDSLWGCAPGGNWTAFGSGGGGGGGSGSSLAITNPGVFTATQMNEYVTSMIGGCSTATEQGFQGGNATNAISGCLIIPSTATVTAGNALAGYVQNTKSQLASPSTTPVGVLGQCRANGANADCLGGSFIATDTSGVTPTGILIGVDTSVTAQDAGATHGSALIGIVSGAEFKGTGPYPTSVAFQASTDPNTGNQWNTAYQSVDGGAAVGFQSGTLSSVSGPSYSQPIRFNSRSSGTTDSAFDIIGFPATPSGVCTNNSLGLNSLATSGMLYTCAAGTSTWTAIGTGGGGGGTPAGATNDIQINAGGGAFGNIATSSAPTGATVIAVNGAAPIVGNPGMSDSPNSPKNSGAAYTFACPSSTSQNDNTHTFRFQTGANTSPVIPLSTSTGCTAAAFTVMIDSGGPYTFTATSPDTLSIYNGITPSLGATSFTANNGSFFTLNQAASGIWEVRLSVAGVAASLSSLSPATAPNTLGNGNNPQAWNWAQTTASQTGMSFGETTAATGATDGVVGISTLGGSTAIPLSITQAGVTSTTASIPALNIAQTVTGTQTTPALNIAQTVNNAGNSTVLIKASLTNTSSLNTSNIFQLFGGSTGTGLEFQVDAAGNTYTNSLVTTASTGGMQVCGTNVGSCILNVSANVGGLYLRGGSDAFTGATAKGGAAILAGGLLTAGTPNAASKEGLAQVKEGYLKGANTIAAVGDVVCATTVPYTVADCPTGATNILGIADSTANPIGVVSYGTVPVLLDGAMTAIGDNVCMSSTAAGQAHDNGSTTTACALGTAIGVIIDGGATAGSVLGSSGSTYPSTITLSATVVLVQLRR